MTPENHRKDARFQDSFAVYLVTLAAGYIAGVTFIPVPKDNQSIVNTVLGFLLGSLVGTIVTYFYGASKVIPPVDPKIDPPTTEGTPHV